MPLCACTVPCACAECAGSLSTGLLLLDKRGLACALQIKHCMLKGPNCKLISLSTACRQSLPTEFAHLANSVYRDSSSGQATQSGVARSAAAPLPRTRTGFASAERIPGHYQGQALWNAYGSNCYAMPSQHPSVSLSAHHAANSVHEQDHAGYEAALAAQYRGSAGIQQHMMSLALPGNL